MFSLELNLYTMKFPFYGTHKVRNKLISVIQVDRGLL